MTLEAAFGAWMRGLRASANLTQADIATYLTESGIPLSQQQVDKIEHGRRAVRVNEAEAILTACGYDLAEWLNAVSSS